MSAKPGNSRQKIREHTARTKKADQEAAPQRTESIKETFRELEVIVEQMENGDSILEESLTSCEVRMKLVKECDLQLDKVEKQIIVLTEDGGDYEPQ